MQTDGLNHSSLHEVQLRKSSKEGDQPIPVSSQHFMSTTLHYIPFWNQFFDDAATLRVYVFVEIEVYPLQ